MKNADEYNDAETVKRRDEVLKRMLNTPPKPHASKGKSRVEKKAPVKTENANNRD